MKKQLRLRHAVDFAHVRQNGHVYRHPFFILTLASNSLSHNRYGFITSKRLGKAVVRNRVRRMMKEAIRTLHPHLKSGFDIVIAARPQVVEQQFQVILNVVDQTLRQASMRHNEDTQNL